MSVNRVNDGTRCSPVSSLPGLSESTKSLSTRPTKEMAEMEVSSSIMRGVPVCCPVVGGKDVVDGIM